jgi:hypothetical protein
VAAGPDEAVEVCGPCLLDVYDTLYTKRGTDSVGESHQIAPVR